MVSRIRRPTGKTKRVFFHVGAPKTGTTYLQSVLFQNRHKLAKAGVLYPYTDPGQHFRSAQDFRGVGWGGGSADEFAGEWEIVAERVRRWNGHTIICSNELLSGSSVERIESSAATLGDVEVNVIYSARDLARQLVSDWQEHIKHRHTITLEKFVDDLIELGLDAPEPFGQFFWGMHDAAYVLDRWSSVAPAESIHVVTLPQSGGPKSALWQRFCAATGLDAADYDTKSSKANASMGVAETELVRRMNFGVAEMAPHIYDSLVRCYLAEEVLSSGGQSARITLPPGRCDWVSQRSEQLIKELRGAGYSVYGDLTELLPRSSDDLEHQSPTALTEQDLGPAALRAATALLAKSGQQRKRISRLQGRLQEARSDSSLQNDARQLYRRVRHTAGRVARGAVHDDEETND
ncbi:MAG: hypothetical protein ACR2KG_10980 [Nocardioidaceae bacterium]